MNIFTWSFFILKLSSIILIKSNTKNGFPVHKLHML